MRYLVTGGGGFLGRHIVGQLLRRGDAVCVFGRGAYPDLAAGGVEVCSGALTDAAALDAACAGVDGVFHVAAKTGIAGRYADYRLANYDGTAAVLAACERAGIRRLVYTSTPSVVFGREPIRDGDESLSYPAQYLTHYARTKAQAEALVLSANRPQLRTCALRPHLIWGPGDTNLLPRMAQRAKDGRLVRVGAGENWVSVSYVENTAQAHLAAMDRLAEEATKQTSASGGTDAEACAEMGAGTAGAARVGGRAFFINEPEAVNCWDFIHRLLDVCGAGPVRRGISFRAAYAAGYCFEQLGRLRPEWEPPMTRFLALQLAVDHTFRPDAAMHALRWRPAFTIEDGLERLRASLH